MATKEPPKPNSLLRKIPSVDHLLATDAAAALVQVHGRDPVVAGIRLELEELRVRLNAGGPLLETGAILNRVTAGLQNRQAPKLCRVVNATGIILHTGLGRAVLPKAALDAIAAEQRGYSLLEVDRETGDRSIRETHIIELVQRITGAEAATVVNNNAGATMIALSALAKGREVIVSRGQLVEIGGSFRIPEVMEMSGAKLVEVGTTNKTYVSDYEKKIREETALLMRVHTSNYRVMGFTETASLKDLVALGKKHSLPVMDDLGSGAFVDMSLFGIKDEPGVQESVRSGADVITFSGDKLLGGPQAGIIVGTRKWIGAIRKSPLFRALRVDKLTLTALEATLKLYLDRDRAMKEIPTLAMLSMSTDELERRALELAAKLRQVAGFTVEILDDSSEVGGGSVPAHQIPTRVVAVRHPKKSLESIAAGLRAGSPCIFARIQRDRVLFDVRTLVEGDIEAIATSIGKL